MTITLNINLSPAIDRLIGGLDSKIDHIIQSLKEQQKRMSKFDDDIAALDAGIEANTTAINQFVAIHKADTDTIASLNQQIADLKAANPAIDLSGLEADIAKLSANNVLATSITSAPAETPGPTDPPPPAGDPPTV